MKMKNEDKFLRIYLPIYLLIITSTFFLIMFFYTRFNFSAPLDDAFIYFQYAKNMAKGHFFEYVKGEGYSSGATSFIYTFLLTPFSIFFKEDKMVFTSYILGIICLFISAKFLYKIIYNLTKNNFFSIAGSFLFITNGNILWGFFSGMEIGIFSTFIILSLYYLFFTNNIILSIVFLSILSLTRPEGYIVVLITVFFKFIELILNKKIKNFLFLIPVMTGFIYFYINYIFTGDFMPNTMRAKSNFSLYYFTYTNMLKHGFEYYLKFLKNIFNGEKEHYFFHYSYFVFLLGILPGIIIELKNKTLGFFIHSFFWFFIGVLSTMFSSFSSVHNYRYTMPFVIIFVIFFINGLYNIFLWTDIKNKKNEKILKIGVFFILFLFNFFTIFSNVINFGRDCNAIYSQSISAGKWLRENIDKKYTVAINDVGAIQYFYDGKIFDLVGLVTNNQAKFFRCGKPSVFEALERKKPEYFMVHVGWFNYEPYTVFKRPRLKEFNLKREPPYYVIGSPEVCVATDFSLFNSGDTMKIDHTENNEFVLIDKIDIADLFDEEKHSYKIWTRWKGERPGTLLKESEYENSKVLDGGRITSGGEEFVIQNVKKYKDLKIVMRTYDTPDVKIKVYINNIFYNVWNIKTKKGFKEEEFLIKGDKILSENLKIKFVLISKNRYNSFYYWFLQNI